MPQADYRVNLNTTFAETEQAILRVLLTEINTLRQAQGLAVCTTAEFRQRVQQELAAVRRETTAAAREGPP
jgi:hypothetical protein